jgi:isopentenyldiphosphate isomerase
MEYFDLLDENGVLAGKTKLRSEVHRDGDWHKTVHMWILNSENELLLQLRSPIKDSNPNMWDISSAGHLSAGQNSIEGALREIKEELGLDLTEGDLEYLFTIKQQSVKNNETFSNNEYADVYLIQLDIELSRIRLQEEEVSEVKFIHFKELEKLVNERQTDIVMHDEEYKRLFEILYQRLQI